MKESHIERTVCKYAESLGWDHFKLASGGKNGKPDREFFRASVAFFVEFKRPGEDPEPLQDYWRRRLKRQGFEVYVIDSIEAGKALFNQMERTK